jgi:hypothetical protein
MPQDNTEQLTALINFSEHTFDISIASELTDKKPYPSGRLS